MSFIDKLGTPSAYGQGASAGAEVRQQSWLKALEDAGLRDALSETRRFRSGAGPVATALEAAPERAGKPAAAARLGETINPMPTDCPPGASAPRETASVGSGSALRRDGSAKLPMGTGVTAFTAPPTLGEPETVGSEIGGDAESRLPLEMMLRQKWQARKVTVLPYEEGVEVWVRDSTVSGEGLKGMLGGVQKSASELGTTVVRVFVNGREVDSSGAPGTGKPANKEG